MLAIFVSMFLVGLVTSVHCISMCGPMVVTYAVKNEAAHWRDKVLPNLAYQLAKLLSYVLIGLLLGTLGKAFNLAAIQPWAMVFAGVFMVIIGLGMTGHASWALRFMPKPPKFLITAISKLRRKSRSDVEQGETSLATAIAFGLLTGLMPCAPLIAAEIAAASSGSILGGGVTMLGFGLGTMPLLFAFGVTASIISRKWKQRFAFMLAFVVMGLGLVFLNRSALLLGFPVNSNTIQTALLGTTNNGGSNSYKTAVNGVVEIPLAISNTQYVPSQLSIPADTKVRIIITRNESNPCSDYFVLPQLGINTKLAPNGSTTIEVPATVVGVYTMTCGMGMMSGNLIVGSVGRTGDFGTPLLWVIVGIGSTLGALWLIRAPKDEQNDNLPPINVVGEESINDDKNNRANGNKKQNNRKKGKR